MRCSFPWAPRTRPAPAFASAMAISRKRRRPPKCSTRLTVSSNCFPASRTICRTSCSTSTGVPEFHRGVYDITRTIPPGKTMTYGDIARRLGGVELSRDVGQALGRNPCPVVVPCHRVLAAGGKPGGFSANGGVTTKLKMLAIEGRDGQPHAEPVRLKRVDAAACAACLMSPLPEGEVAHSRGASVPDLRPQIQAKSPAGKSRRPIGGSGPRRARGNARGSTASRYRNSAPGNSAASAAACA